MTFKEGDLVCLADDNLVKFYGRDFNGIVFDPLSMNDNVRFPNNFANSYELTWFFDVLARQITVLVRSNLKFLSEVCL